MPTARNVSQGAASVISIDYSSFVLHLWSFPDLTRLKIRFPSTWVKLLCKQVHTLSFLLPAHCCSCWRGCGDHSGNTGSSHCSALLPPALLMLCFSQMVFASVSSLGSHSQTGSIWSSSWGCFFHVRVYFCDATFIFPASLLFILPYSHLCSWDVNKQEKLILFYPLSVLTAE